MTKFSTVLIAILLAFVMLSANVSATEVDEEKQAEEIRLKADKLFQEKRYAEAIPLLEKLLGKYGDIFDTENYLTGQVHQQLGWAYHKIGRATDAHYEFSFGQFILQNKKEEHPRLLLSFYITYSYFFKENGWFEEAMNILMRAKFLVGGHPELDVIDGQPGNTITALLERMYDDFEKELKAESKAGPLYGRWREEPENLENIYLKIKNFKGKPTVILSYGKLYIDIIARDVAWDGKVLTFKGPQLDPWTMSLKLTEKGKLAGVFTKDKKEKKVQLRRF